MIEGFPISLLKKIHVGLYQSLFVKKLPFFIFPIRTTAIDDMIIYVKLTKCKLKTIIQISNIQQ